jgi:hypothetical protein
MALTRPSQPTTQHDHQQADQGRQKDEPRALLLGKSGQGHVGSPFLRGVLCFWIGIGINIRRGRRFIIGRLSHAPPA